MDNEMVDILDEQGNPTGEVKLKREAHAKGLWHRAVHIWIYNSKGEILLQKRAKHKNHFANLWDISAAGHVSAGQTFDQAAERELFEELGLRFKSSELKKVEVRRLVQDVKEPFMRNREFAQVYLLKWDGNEKDLKLQEEEVEQAKFISLEKFESEIGDLKKAKKYVPHGKAFLDIINYIRKELKKE